MLQTQSLAPSTRWHSALGQPARQPVRKPVVEEVWSDTQELMNLLHFVDHVHGLDESRRFQRRRLQPGQTAFRMGETFEGLYVVRFGALKTSITHDDGNEHVLAFPMKGDLLGFDGVCEHHYLSEVVALTDCELIKLPTEELFSPGRGCNEIERMAYWAMSREVVQEQAAYAISHTAKAEARVARFIRLQSERFAAMGYSSSWFSLPMTRRDIGNYLNVTLETVSRAFSSLHHLGIIEVDKRDIKILSPQALREFEG